MFEKSSAVRPLAVLAGLILPFLGNLGCTGGNADVNSVLGIIANSARKSTLMVRVVNQTTSSVEVLLRVDGEDKLLAPCTSLQQVCNYILTTCPTTVELIEETRRNTEGNFTGGRNFEGNPNFIFGPGDIECGDTLMLQFSESSASAIAL